MTTFLQGVKDLCVECGIASEPTTVDSQTGEFKRMVNWYKQAWVEIQNRTDWRWMRHEFSLNTVADTEVYTFADCTDLTSSATITRFKKWRFEDVNDPPKIYLQSTGVGGERWLLWTPWNWFKTIYSVGTQNSGATAHITVDPQDQIHLGPIPNDVYVVTGDYYRSPQVLAADDDEPEMPSHFHYLIVYEAMKKYAYFESAQEVLSRAEVESKKLMRQLEREQGPKWGMAGPMA